MPPKKTPAPARLRAPHGTATEQLLVRCDEELKRQVQAAAAAAGLTQADWIRQTLQKAAEKTLERHSRK